MGLDYPISKGLSWFGEVNLFYSWARYGGLYLRPDDGLAITPRTGVKFIEVFQNNDALILGVEYRDTFAPIQRLYFHLGYSIKINNR